MSPLDVFLEFCFDLGGLLGPVFGAVLQAVKALIDLSEFVLHGVILAKRKKSMDRKHRDQDERDWTPSRFDFPEADHGQSSNPPLLKGHPPKLSVGEIMEYHRTNGSLDDTVRNYCGVFLDRGRDR